MPEALWWQDIVGWTLGYRYTQEPGASLAETRYVEPSGDAGWIVRCARNADPICGIRRAHPIHNMKGECCMAPGHQESPHVWRPLGEDVVVLSLTRTRLVST
jgi:hypothetical protein